MRDEPARHARSEQRLAGGDRADRGQQLLQRAALQREAARSGPQRLKNVLVQVERGEDQHPGHARALAGGDLPGGLDTVHHRHPDVHHDDVRPEARSDLDGLAAVARLTDDLQVVLRVDERGERGTEQRLVVDDEDPDRHPAPSIGTWAFTRKPRPASGSAASQPPNAAIRSRIPTIPWPGPVCRSPAAGDPGGPAGPPSSVTSLTSSRISRSETERLTAARAPGACLTTLV